MFSKRYEAMEEQMFDLQRDFHYTTNYLENRIAQLESFIISSGLAEKYEESEKEFLFNFAGDLYGIKGEN